MHNNEIVNFCVSFSAIIHSLLSVLFWVLVIYGFDEAASANLTLLSALIHESGHLVYCLIRGRGMKNLYATWNGIKIQKASHLSYSDELRLCLAGPLSNILTSAICSLIGYLFCFDYLEFFAMINLLTALTNLIPIDGYDGNRIICCILKMLNAHEFFFSLLNFFSILLIILFNFVSLYLMYRLDGGYWIYLVFMVLLYGSFDKTLKSTFSED